MHTEIKRERLRTLEQLESRPDYYLSDELIIDFLYGARDGKELRELQNELKRLETLDTWTVAQWTELIQKYLVDNPRLVSIGRPSAKLANDLRAEGKAALAERKKRFGPEGLKRLGDNLDAARRANDKPIPDSIISGFKIPSAKTIDWIPVGVGRVLPTPDSAVPPLGSDVSELDAQVQAHLDADATQLPFFAQFDHISSAFVSVSVTFNTTGLPVELYPYISLFRSTLFALPLERQDGTGITMTKDEVIEQLNVDTLDYYSTRGVNGRFRETLIVELRAEASKYRVLIAWLRDVLAGARFDTNELEITLRKQLQSLPSAKRSGRRVLSSVVQEMTLDPTKSTAVHNTLFAQMTDLPAQLEQLHPEGKTVDEQANEVARALERVREHLLQPQNVRVHVIGNVLGLQEPKRDWADAQFGLPSWWEGKAHATAPIDSELAVHLPKAAKPAFDATVCAVSSIESSYAVFLASGLTDFHHPDLPALMVAVGMLNALEGFLWRFIRGAGLAYGASLYCNPVTGYVSFSLERSPNAAAAYIEARRLLRALGGDSSAQRGDEVLEIDEAMIQSAKSSLVYEVAEDHGSGPMSAEKTFVETVLQGAGKNYGRQLLVAMETVTVEQVQQAIRTYLAPIFDPATSIAGVAASVEVAEKIETQLKEVGYHVKRRELAADDAEGESEGSASGSDESGSEESESGSDEEMSEEES